MGAALMVVPGMALAWLWVAPRGRLVAIRQLAIAGAALLAVALAWPVLVWLTPAANRPWISGTSDNSIWSLIWEYNGFGRLEGQTGGPSSLGTSGTFGGATGPFRLLNEALGGQAGWLLGAALAGGLGIAALSRLRRTDARTGWIIAVGGAFATTAVAFSFAGGIFHPYYTSLLAPFAAALVGATVGQVLAAEREGGRAAVVSRVVGAVAIGLGAIVELVVISNGASDLDWLVVPLVVVSVAALSGHCLFGTRERCARSGPRLRGGGPPRRSRDLVGRHARPPDQQHLPRRRPRIGVDDGRPRRRRRPGRHDRRSRRDPARRRSSFDQHGRPNVRTRSVNSSAKAPAARRRWAAA